MKNSVFKTIVILLLITALTFLLASCSIESRVYRQAKRNKCPLYKGSYAKWNHHKIDQTHIMTKR